MTSIPADQAPPSAIKEIPDWLLANLHPIHADFEKRVVCLESDVQWLDTALLGVQVRIMEYVSSSKPRLAAQLRFRHGHEPLPMGRYPDLEILIQHGALCSAHETFRENSYIRLPTPGMGNTSTTGDEVVIKRSNVMQPDDETLLYMAVGQMQQSDTEWRKIDTTRSELWFPGPVEGTDVLPLHGHGTGNVMLVRWNETVAFKTRIDPRGEELLVLDGAVYDAQGYYPQGTWIRNPIAAWQSWGATAGTVIYYKNGHFADSDTH